jgi:predicted murein hydrolase (TIGR00659 family)
VVLLKMSSLLLTVLFYWCAKQINRRKPGLLFSPAVLGTLSLIVVLVITGIPYQVYQEGTSLFQEMLGIVTVAFAVPLHRNWPILQANWRVIVFSLTIGSVIGVLAGVATTMLLGLGADAAISVIPRSITLPIAVGLSDSLHGVPSLTAVFVMLTSFAGVFLGPKIIRGFSVRHPLAIGMMYGLGAHALGTVKAFEHGDLEGTCSSLSIIVGAVATVAWAYTLMPVVKAWIG